MRPRDRIMSRLRAVGEVADPGGLASRALAEAVGYPGSSVAFAQLLSAMERSGLIEREIRGRRTYRIGLAGAVAPRVREAGPGAPVRTARPEPGPALAAPGSGPGACAAPGFDADPPAVAGVDYDELARWLVAEMLRRLTAAPGTGPARAGHPGWPGDPAQPGVAAQPGDLARQVASLEGRLARLESRHRRLQAETARLGEMLTAARQSLAEQQRVAAWREPVPARLDAGAVQLLERLMSSLRGGAAREDDKTQAG